MSFLPLYFYFIVLSFIASFFSFFDARHSYLKLFTLFLFCTLIAEYIGLYQSSIGKNNLVIYNFFTVFEFFFYMQVISLIIKNHTAGKIIRLCSYIYSVVAIAYIVFFEGIKTFHILTYTLGCLVIVAVCIYYFLELFRNPKSVNLSRNPAFWICSGLLFFYCCGFPLYAFLNFWARFRWMTNNFTDILNILNIFLYSLFTIAFLCSRTPKYTSSSS
jgi:hypothetical protein